MTVVDPHKVYMAKAEEAECQAGRAVGEVAKSTWLRVAAGYRDLAKMTRVADRNRD